MHRLAPRVVCRSSSTNHHSTDSMSCQFLFYREKEAICCDDEPPCWNVPGWQRNLNGIIKKNSVRIIDQYYVIIASDSCIDDVTITHLFSFEMVSGLGMNGMIFVYLRLHEGSKCKCTGVFFNSDYHQRVNSRLGFHVFQVPWQKDSVELWIVWEVTL